jgi:hypothetical protein
LLQSADVSAEGARRREGSLVMVVGKDSTQTKFVSWTWVVDLSWVVVFDFLFLFCKTEFNIKVVIVLFNWCYHCCPVMFDGRLGRGCVKSYCSCRRRRFNLFMLMELVQRHRDIMQFCYQVSRHLMNYLLNKQWTNFNKTSKKLYCIKLL